MSRFDSECTNVHFFGLCQVSPIVAIKKGILPHLPSNNIDLEPRGRRGGGITLPLEEGDGDPRLWVNANAHVIWQQYKIKYSVIEKLNIQ